MTENSPKNQSALAQFKLGYELDRSWSEAKKHVKSRTIDTTKQ